jgi:LemA protein
MVWVGIVLLVVLVYFIYSYNSIVSLKNRAESSWSDIEVQLKKRFNLIPNLVNIIKGYTKYESDTLEKVIKARNMFLNAKDENDKIKASNILQNSLSGIFALSEAYPNLKANDEFLNLQKELSKLENDIENARRYYNAVVRDYNTKLDTFPDMIIAKKFHFIHYPYFEVENKEVYKTPKVEF